MNRNFQEIFTVTIGMFMLGTASMFGGERLRYDQLPGSPIVVYGSYSPTTLAEFISRAEKGNSGSQVVLAEIYYGGTKGATVNKVEAYRWAFIAASQGHKPAKYLLEEFDLFLTDADKAAGRKLADLFLSKQKSKPN